MSSLKNGYKVFKICQKGVFNLRIENKNTWRLFNEVKKKIKTSLLETLTF